MDTIFRQIETLLKHCDTTLSCLPPALLYNEGWMLRATVDRFASLDLGSERHPLAVPANCRWYSEALLPSAFLPESRGDSRGESWTHADGVIGQFDIGGGTKGDLTLHRDATHFVVLEAKMFSKLSSGVKHASHFNQAARNVACMAEVLKRAGRRPAEFSALGFYVLAPASQIEQSVFADYLGSDALRRTVEKRVSQYGGTRDTWFREWFLPTHEKLDVKAISWEELISFLAKRDDETEELRGFYGRCLEFNRPREESEA